MDRRMFLHLTLMTPGAGLIRPSQPTEAPFPALYWTGWKPAGPEWYHPDDDEPVKYGQFLWCAVLSHADGHKEIGHWYVNVTLYLGQDPEARKRQGIEHAHMLMLIDKGQIRKWLPSDRDETCVERWLSLDDPEVFRLNALNRQKERVKVSNFAMMYPRS